MLLCPRHCRVPLSVNTMGVGTNRRATKIECRSSNAVSSKATQPPTLAVGVHHVTNGLHYGYPCESRGCCCKTCASPRLGWRHRCRYRWGIVSKRFISLPCSVDRLAIRPISGIVDQLCAVRAQHTVHGRVVSSERNVDGRGCVDIGVRHRADRLGLVIVVHVEPGKLRCHRDELLDVRGRSAFAPTNPPFDFLIEVGVDPVAISSCRHFSEKTCKRGWATINPHVERR